MADREQASRMSSDTTPVGTPTPPLKTFNSTRSPRPEKIPITILPNLDAYLIPKGKKAAPPQPTPRHQKLLTSALTFTTYRLFFVVTFSINLIGVCLAATNHFTYGFNHAGAFVLGNLTTAILFRNEIILRILYWLVNKLLARWSPLIIRLGASSALQHVGGIHTGCACSAFLWLIYRVVELIVWHGHTSVIATGATTAACMAITILTALPWIRNHHHNIFENHHRFVGWLGVVFTYVFVIVGNGYNPNNGDKWDSSTHYLAKTQEFWFTVITSIFVALPWFFVRKVPVEIEVPSSKMAIIKFKRGMQQGLLGRVSRPSSLEFHIFGIISESTKADCHYMVCGVQGDFTRGLVANPPTHLWTREVKFAGVANTSTLYKRGVRIATGTGIGAALSTCLQSPDWFLIWIGSGLEETFGPTVMSLVESIEPSRRILWDSKKMGGRPDTMALLEDAVRGWGAEVVFITSNEQGNREMMEGCTQRGIPNFGVLFDF